RHVVDPATHVVKRDFRFQLQRWRFGAFAISILDEEHRHERRRQQNGESLTRAHLLVAPPELVATNAFTTEPRPEAPQLVRWAVTDRVEQCYAIGFSPQAHLSSFGERFVYDLEQLPAVIDCNETAAFEFGPQAEPLVGRHGNVDPIAALAADNIK